MEEKTVVIVGAGPSGIATSICLSKLNIENVILEKEDCFGSLWKKRAYDQLRFHFPEDLCELPFLLHITEALNYMSKGSFINYLDNYVTCAFDRYSRKWVVEVQSTIIGAMEIYIDKYIVIAMGDNSEPNISKLPGLESFVGEVSLLQEFKNGSIFFR